MLMKEVLGVKISADDPPVVVVEPPSSAQTHDRRRGLKARKSHLSLPYGGVNAALTSRWEIIVICVATQLSEYSKGIRY